MSDGRAGRIRLAAYTWCEADGRVLLVRIREGFPGAGHWTLPGGGVDFGEHPAEAALRELEEETGLRGRLRTPLGVHSRVFGPEATKTGEALQAVAIVYRAAIVGGTLRDEPSGSSDRAAWVPSGEIRELPIGSLVKFVLRRRR